MTRIAAAGFAAVLSLLVAEAAAAQGSTTPPGDSKGAAPSGASTPAPDAAALARSARASKLIGSHVYAHGADIGSIKDILIDREHGAVAAAVLGVGGFLGAGEKLVALPITAIKIDGEAHFTVDLT